MRRFTTIMVLFFLSIMFLVVTIPSAHAAFNIPAGIYDDEFRNLYYIDTVNLVYTDASYDYWEVALDFIDAPLNGIYTFIQITDVNNYVDLRNMYLTTLIVDSWYGSYVFFADNDGFQLEAFRLNDSDMLSNYIFDLEIYSSVLSFHIVTYKGEYTSSQVITQIQQFMNSLVVMTGYMTDNINNIVSYYSNVQSYETGYQNGYTQGSSEGYNEGMEQYGYYDSVTNTYLPSSNAYTEGYNDGVNAGFPSVFGWMGIAASLLDQILTTEFAPGWSIGMLVFIPLGFGLMMLFLKIFKRGG